MSIKKLEQSHVDLSKVVPLNGNRLVAFINHVVIRVTEQLNDLTVTVDSRLYDLNEKINHCNANLTILETKLNSIPGLGVASAQVTPVKPAVVAEQSVPEVSQLMSANESASEIIPEKETVAETNSSTAVEEESEPVEEDPGIARYRKMLQVGVPYAALIPKMIADGIDPEILAPK
ncbi:hypothetical protein HDE_02578 [Halotydeus destructor]|nr:hypothetical protein HDE_02578 [Halotydeus destructor]